METLLLDCSIRAILMAAGTAAALGALRVRAPAARHIAWTGVLVTMLLLPALTLWGPKVTLPVLPASRDQLSPESPVLERIQMPPASQHVDDKKPTGINISHRAEPQTPKWNWAWIAVACYFIGFGAMVIRLVAGTLQARKMLRLAVLVDGVLVSAQCAAPVTVGWLRPKVVLPGEWQSWPEAKLDAVLTHEREHARRRDPLIQWLALLNRSIFWFHPLAWWLERKLSNLAEEACDAAVLTRGHTPHEYSQYLIELARSIERAGGRVRVWGSRMDNNALSGRIRRILDSRPVPPLSRIRLSVAAAVCLSVLAVFAACKLERASNVAPGQPSMNEMMHRMASESEVWEKQRQALMDEVQKLTPDQARALEAELKTNPQDTKKLIKLVRYYQYRLGGQGFSAITLWYIEHEPAMSWRWNINPEWDRAGYEQGKKFWLAHLKEPGASAPVYRNAARFLEGGDKPLAEEVLLAGQKAYPNENCWAMDLGIHYAQALLGSTGPLAEFNVIRTVSMKEAHGAYARSVRRKLAASNDPQILMQTAQWLMGWGSPYLFPHKKQDRPLDFDVLALAKSYNDRALSLQPDCRAALTLKLRLEGLATGERLRNTPPEQMSQSDRMRLLRGKVEDAFWHRKIDEAESKAQELLALAARSTNDPEYGNAIFFANVLLGNVALRRGNKGQATSHLLAASDAPQTDQLRYEDIDLTLARQLVDWGEREAVAQFLDRCARFNHRGKELAEWAAQIRKGINPDLMPYRSI